jgi:hypothetical protein
VVVDKKVIARPEEAVAVSVIVAFPKGTSESGPKVTVWLWGATLKLWSTGVAALNPVLPVWEASMVQVPAETSVTVAPETVHTGAVIDLKLTVRPDEAVALTVKGDAPNVWSGIVPNVIV